MRRGQSFAQMILENLKTAGVQQAHKEDKINFSSLTPWPGDYICAEGRYSRAVKRQGTRKAGRHLHRPGIWHGGPPRSGGRRPRGRAMPALTC